MKETGPFRPNTKPAPTPARTRSRREISNMLSSWSCPVLAQGVAAMVLPAPLYTPELARQGTPPADHGKVTPPSGREAARRQSARLYARFELAAPAEIATYPPSRRVVVASRASGRRGKQFSIGAPGPPTPRDPRAVGTQRHSAGGACAQPRALSRARAAAPGLLIPRVS